MIPAALAKLITEPPVPSFDGEGALAIYWSKDAIDARARRRRLRAFAGWTALAAVAAAVAILAFVVGVDFGVLIVGLHMPVVAVALVLLAVPTWRRLLLSQTWSPILFLFAGYGVFYIAMFWPNALGGWSVGFPLVLALIAGLLVLAVFTLINQWRSDRRSTIDLLAMLAVGFAGAVVGERFFGKDYGWLAAFAAMLAYSGFRRLFGARSQ